MLFALAALAGFAAPAVASEGTAGIAERSRTLMVLGDSLSAAYGIELDQGWVALLEARLVEQAPAWQVVNASISGDTTAGGLARLDAALALHAPSLLLLELGGNDGLRGIDMAATRDNLEAIISRTLATGADVVLLGIRLPPNFGEAFNRRFAAIYQELAEQYRLALLPFLLEGVGGVDGLMQGDGIHPTAEAQPGILENVWPVIEPLLTQR